MKTKSFSSGDVRIRDGMSLIEGGLPIPDGMPDISCVLAITGTAQTDEVICTEGMVTIKGKAFFQVLYVDSENQPHSFDAECAFTQNVEGDFSEGMTTCAAVRIGEISFKESPRRIDIRAELLSDVFAGKNEVCEIIDESEGVEVLKNTQRISNLNDLKHAQAFTKGTIVIPQSMPDTIYMDIMADLQDKGVEIAVDATRDLLMNVLPYRPFLIKPNNHELGEIFGVELKKREEVIPYAKKLQEKGAKNVLVSMAGEGAVLIDENGREYMSPVPKGKVVNAVGAGDSMVAGFIAGYLEKKDYEYAFHMGIASGSASAFSEQLATRAEVEALLKTIHPAG